MKICTLNVFTDEANNFGNPVGIILDETNQLDKTSRQKIATQLEYSETVFITDVSSGQVKIHNPQKEISFAGHALLGTAYFLNQLTQQPVLCLTCRTTTIVVSQDPDLTWIKASLEVLPPWRYEQLESADQVESISSKAALLKPHTMVWAWIDESKSLIRARTFANDWGIPEDEANGSGSMRLAVTIGEFIEVRHGKGSIIYAEPEISGYASLGGRVKILL